jgi:hypothetical protein
MDSLRRWGRRRRKRHRAAGLPDLSYGADSWTRLVLPWRFMDAFNLNHQFEYQHLQQSANCSSPDNHTDRGQLQLAAERRRVSDRRHPDHSDAYPLPAGNRHHQHHELGQLWGLSLWWNWDSRSHGGHGRDLHRWSGLRDNHLHPCLGLWRAARARDKLIAASVQWAGRIMEKIDSVFSSSAKT